MPPNYACPSPRSLYLLESCDLRWFIQRTRLQMRLEGSATGGEGSPGVTVTWSEAELPFPCCCSGGGDEGGFRSESTTRPDSGSRRSSGPSNIGGSGGGSGSDGEGVVIK